MPATYSHYTVLRLSPPSAGRLVFPGRSRYEPDTMGFVRSAVRAAESLAHRKSGGSTPALPWRDYPVDLLTSTDDVLVRSGHGGFEGERLLISARNVVNEFGHRARIGGHWYGRGGDPPIDPSWPVLEISEEGALIRELAEVGSGDVLTGVPLVRNGVPTDRVDLVAWCSDQAHVFDIHPRGLRGPAESSAKQRSEIWATLSDGWQLGRNEGVSNDVLSERLEHIAAGARVQPSRDLLHSVLAQTSEGGIVILVAVGALDRLASVLVNDFGVRDAIVLDTGGSVGPVYVPRRSTSGQVLVAAPNRRGAGTVFIDFWIGSFPQPAASV